MEIKLVYPPKKRIHKFWRVFCFIYNIIFVTSLFVCPTVNIIVGGKAWSVIVLFSEYLIWSSFISPSLYDLNRTSQSIKLLLNILILLILIDVLIKTGWGMLVIPIVSFVGLIACVALFFSDFERQKHNAAPFLLFSLLALGAGLFGIFAPSVDVKWNFYVLAGLSFVTIIVSLILLRKTIWLDLKKMFNSK